MLFTSIDFLVYLPIVFFLYWFAFAQNVKIQNAFLLVASYVFYGWWNWRFLFLIVFISLTSWITGLLIEKRQNDKKKKKALLIVNIVVSLTILFVFKYYNFFIQSLADLLFHGDTHGLLLNVILPIGISFYTFQSLGYSIDVYRGTIRPTKNVIAYLTFVSFFPQLVAGPIERAANLLPQFEKPRTFDYNLASDGVLQFIWGLFKKVVVADNCALFVYDVFHYYDTMSGSYLTINLFMLSFMIYADFSGYSDMAIGTAKLFGIKLMRNFNNPYFSRNIGEFWRRWHISLTTWFRDYVYFPLGGSRKSKANTIRNIIIVFLLSAVWHGAGLNYILWGLYHSLLFIFFMLINCNQKYTVTVAKDRLLPSFKELGQMYLTFVFVSIGWILLYCNSTEVIGTYIKGMANFGSLRSVYRFFTYGYPFSVFVVIMIVVEWLQRNRMHGLDLSNVRSPLVRCLLGIIVLLSVLLLSMVNSIPFIYFQF